MSPVHEPELLPGLPATSDFALFALKEEFRRVRMPDEDNLSKADSLVIFVGMTMWIVPAWLYRFSLKSTAWVWWPLAFIVAPPKLAKTPAWQYRAMVGTLLGWMAIIAASYSDAIFVFSNFLARIWREGFPSNPLLTPLGYLFMLDWSGSFWPLFSIVGPTISIVTLFWLNRAFSKYETATKHGYAELQREAERTFPIVERVQRVQFVLFVVYCLLVVIQAALYVNTQRCWVVVPLNVQSWSDRLFGDKSPHQSCNIKTSAVAVGG